MKFIRYSVITIVVLVLAFAMFLYKGEIPAAVVDAKYTNAASQFFTMDNGARVHYRDQGNPSGPAVVLVHGSNASLLHLGALGAITGRRLPHYHHGPTRPWAHRRDP